MSLKNIVVNSVVIATLALLGFLVLQVLPIGQPTNPPIVAEPHWDNPQTRALAKRACFDCHSNETIYPWYAQIAPVKWLVVNDAVQGRRELNFSDWHSGGRNVNDRIARVITRGEMPPFFYLTMHPGARLGAAEQQQLIDGLLASLK